LSRNQTEAKILGSKGNGINKRGKKLWLYAVVFWWKYFTSLPCVYIVW